MSSTSSSSSSSKLDSSIFEKLCKTKLNFDNEGFVIGIPLDGEHNDEIVKHFDEYGFVVISNFISPQQCERTISDIYGLVENANPAFKRDDPSTWDEWKDRLFGMPQREPVFTKHFVENRQNPKLLQLGHLLYNHNAGVAPGEPNRMKDGFLVSHDRASFLRPTAHNNKWKTSHSLHLDMDAFGFRDDAMGKVHQQNLDKLRYTKPSNFIYENNQVHASMYDELHLQMGLNLAHNREEDGGFIIIPGFHKVFDDWVAFKLKETAHSPDAQQRMVKSSNERNSIRLQPKDPLQKFAKRIPLRAGALVVWNQKCFHGASPNHSNSPRFAEFLRIFPRDGIDKKRLEARACVIQQMIRKEAGMQFEITEHGKILFGFKIK